MNANYSYAELDAMRNFSFGVIAESNTGTWDDWYSLPNTNIDLHFITNDDPNNSNFGSLEIFGYRRDKFAKGDCVDEIRLFMEDK